TGFAWAYPEGGGLRSEREAEERNREIIESSTIENWLPYSILTDHEGRDEIIEEGTLLACDRMHHPDEFSGFTTLSLVTLGPDALNVTDSTGIFADGDIVYSSDDATYVATTRWQDPIIFDREERPGSVETKIHKFSLSPSGASYRASGAVPGYMLSQWSMSEHDGYLRVASTDSPQWWDGPESESMVTVLDTTGDELVKVGSVDGLGRGERIYSVRFFADRGYVVTFRQVDPLYVIDLSDPEDPSIEGELKIPGYSAYLHPISDDHLLGVGQDADLDGRTLGLQASLFDVSDADDPERTDRFTMKDAQSELEWDHHAFLHDPSSGVTVFPYQRWNETKDGPPPTGALVLTVTDDGIRKAGVISHDQNGSDWWMPIRRTLLIDGNLVTISDGGVMVSDTSTLETLDWVRF
ncbi:MAG: beta-propeller domain-containing protein, partial [Actinomycetota bacterium]|nr:beta-propeller domain-containing protein [Actinomycetota bacterium]